MRSVLLDPGALRNELRLEKAEAVADGLGGYSESWSEVAVLFGLVEPVAAVSVFRADQATETVTHRVTIRWRNDIRSGMRFRKGERVFDIITVFDPDETGRYLICRTREDGL
jgi:SPP1 family predicted phage head-tail adaptor